MEEKDIATMFQMRLYRLTGHVFGRGVRKFTPPTDGIIRLMDVPALGN